MPIKSLADRLLDLYFRGVLEIAALLPPYFVYNTLPSTGWMFRDFEQYASSYQPGVLPIAVRNVENTDLPVASSRRLIKEYLRFETRFVIENIWIRRKWDSYALRCFDPLDVRALRKLINRECVIVTAHTSGICMLVRLLGILKHPNVFVCMNVLNCPWESATPMQRAFQKMWIKWQDNQEMIYVEKGNVTQKSLRTIEEGKSLVMAVDVPGHKNGAEVELFGMRILMPVGAVKLAAEANRPILIVVPWAYSCRAPYRLFMRVEIPTGEFEIDTITVSKQIEKALRYNPACWNGWLYLDQMAR